MRVATLHTHTPGPWSMTRDTDADREIIWRIKPQEDASRGYDHCLADVRSGCQLAGFGAAIAEAAANARLIAAAPDLLEAAREIVDTCIRVADPRMGSATDLDAVGFASIDRLRAAIARAEGREVKP